MEEKRWETYLDEVLSFVTFKYDHKTIRRELAEHMMDLQEDLMAEGMDEETAAYMTVEYMGDAAEIGQELNKEHSALLGRCWRMARGLVILLVILNIPAAVSIGTMLFAGRFAEYNPSTQAALVWQKELEGEYQIYDDTLLLGDLYYYEDGTLELVYYTKRSPFARSIDWSLTLSLDVLDAEGNSVQAGGGGYKDSGYYAVGCNHLDGVPADAKTLQIFCAKNLNILVDLETGEVTADA